MHTPEDISRFTKEEFIDLFLNNLIKLHPYFNKLKIDVEKIPMETSDIYVRIVGEYGPLRTWAQSFVYHIIYIPEHEWKKEISADIFNIHLEKAFQDLNKMKNPISLLYGDNIAPDMIPIVTDCNYYILTNAPYPSDDESISKVCKTARKIYSNTIADDEDRGLIFGMGTPEVISEALKKANGGAP
ncbi:hypothetical protein ACFSM5_07980 [Lacibacterium aquatile]|uniref:Uncharacterized protein n=1 Tax=Lacibacterium aquatile TaxID=1168082 RepID=A0ABW5DNY0_9PROT